MVNQEIKQRKRKLKKKRNPKKKRNTRKKAMLTTKARKEGIMIIKKLI